ncbi:MAG TPA: sigma-70 family RNA polymerase sigma factor [Polyangiaceae bacterium]|jgi:RNA polymerase sigma-70 factor (ECF subfamily)
MSELDTQFFRHEYGRLVAMLSRRVGVHRLEQVEDAVQEALTTAVETWPKSSVPENPSAWLYRVALNQLTGGLRLQTRRQKLAEHHDFTGGEVATDVPHAFLAADVRDDLLRMLFACCDPAIPVESQLVLALKVLCGFDVREIAERLFLTEANVYKRVARARSRLAEAEIELGEITPEELRARVPAVQSILYVLFTEGHLSSHVEGPIRLELCDEAIRLARELAEHPISATPETFALIALMHFHRARMPSRQDGSGGLLLLEEQDRALWDQSQIQDGLSWLARSAGGEAFSRYHAEAGIAAEHCMAASFAATRWDRIVECYELLDRVAPSALHTLNRAVALAQSQGPNAGLALLAGLEPPSWLLGSYLWAAVLCDLHRRANHRELAEQHRIVALDTAPSPVVRAALERRLHGQ